MEILFEIHIRCLQKNVNYIISFASITTRQTLETLIFKWFA